MSSTKMENQFPKEAAAIRPDKALAGEPLMRTIYGDPDRYVENYWSRFPENISPADGCKRDKDGDTFGSWAGSICHEYRRPSDQHDGGGKRAGGPSKSR